MFRTVQVHIIVVNDNQCRHLALKRSMRCKLYPGMWQTVTGKVEDGESAPKAAIRELEEETGLSDGKWYKVPYLGGFYDMKRNTVESVPTFAFVIEKFPNIELSDEHSEYSWIKMEELETYYPIPDHINGSIQCEKILDNSEQKRIFEI